MGDNSSIAWTDATWNPLLGCRPVSPGCKNCYAQDVAAWQTGFKKTAPLYEGLLKKIEGPPRWSGEFRLLPDRLEQPLRWRKPRIIFVNSMSDLFLEGVPFEFIGQCVDVMTRAHWHTFIVLTKRPEIALKFCAQHGAMPANVIFGVSAENQEWYDRRVPVLLEIPATVRAISMEPLLGPIVMPETHMLGAFDHCPYEDNPEMPEIDQEDPCSGCPGWGPECGSIRGSKVDWVIVGGESGNRARRCDVDWIRGLVGQCQENGVKVFVKQVGAVAFSHLQDDWKRHRRVEDGYTAQLEDRKGETPDEWPADIRVREFPKLSPPIVSPGPGGNLGLF